MVKKHVKKLIAIVDQPSKKHASDILIDQTYGREMDTYQYYVDNTCQLLLGSQYALLSKSFQQLRVAAYYRRKVEKSVTRVLISFGGADKKNLTAQVLKYLCKKTSYKYNVVLGATALHLNSVKKIAKKYKECVTLHFNSKSIAKLMCESDVAIGAAGSTSWERCCLALPTLALASVNNQRDILATLVANKAAFDIGCDNELDYNKLGHYFDTIVANYKLRLGMAENARKLCDGAGVARVLRALHVF